MRNKIYISLLITSFSIMVAVEMMKPKKIDWTPSYSNIDKNPFGNYILYKLLDRLFPGKKIKVIHKSFYKTIKENNKKNNNYIIIGDLKNFDEYDTSALMDFIKNGGQVFISAHKFPENISKIFKLKIELLKLSDSDVALSFTNRRLKRKKYYYSSNSSDFYFSSFKKKNATVLGINHKNRVTFLRYKHGRGKIYLTSTPLIFSNYYLLKKDNWEYIFKALSYLPERNTYWDEYYKPGWAAPGTPLRFILQSRSLKWAYYIMITAIILFMIIKSRRKQRIIPQWDMKKNTTLDFIKTIGKLYLHQGSHKDIAEKNILFFQDKIKTKFGLNIHNYSKKTNKLLAQKLAIDEKEIVDLFEYIVKIKKERGISEKELFFLNNKLNYFNSLIEKN